MAAFVQIAERNSFSKAATYLGVSPSALSQNIRALEARMGVRLLSRTTRSVAPTEAGERLLELLRPALTCFESAHAAINNFRGQATGTLRLTLPSMAVPVVIPVLARFLAAHPLITLDAVIIERLTDIVADRFDAGIRTGRMLEVDMRTVRMPGRATAVFVASPAYLARHGEPSRPRDLRHHDCIRHRHSGTDTTYPWIFQSAGQQFRSEVTGSLILSDLHAILSAAVDGMGIANLTEEFAAGFLADGRLSRVLVGWERDPSDFFLYFSGSGAPPPALQALINFLQREISSER